MRWEQNISEQQAERDFLVLLKEQNALANLSRQIKSYQTRSLSQLGPLLSLCRAYSNSSDYPSASILVLVY